jgi:glycosyltransferase involved in cell wall biosynthesis
MNILILWRETPHLSNVTTSKLYTLMEYLYKKNHEVILIYFKNGELDTDLRKYGRIYEMEYPSRFERYIGCVKNFCKSHRFHLPIFPYSERISKLIKKILSDESIDVIYADQPMLYHLQYNNRNVPVIVDIIDPLVYSTYQMYLQERKIKKKLVALFLFLNYKYLVFPCLKEYNGFIFVTPIHKELMSKYIPKKAKVFYIPQGVDMRNFVPIPALEEDNILIFTGLMSYKPNYDAVIHFHESILPLIQKKIPDVKLYIVGNNPPPEVKALQSKNILVTGYVQSINDYFNKASVVIVPIVTDDGGYKMKVLEGMAMKKAVVSSILGAKGLSVTHRQNILIAETENEFAEYVIELLTDNQKREFIGSNARSFVETHYSLEQTNQMVESAIKSF